MNRGEWDVGAGSVGFVNKEQGAQTILQPDQNGMIASHWAGVCPTTQLNSNQLDSNSNQLDSNRLDSTQLNSFYVKSIQRWLEAVRKRLTDIFDGVNLGYVKDVSPQVCSLSYTDFTEHESKSYSRGPVHPAPLASIHEVN